MRELDVALQASRAAVETAQRMQAGITADTKSDDSPVTAADRECERLISEILIAAFPDDGILGEEGARRESSSGRRWIVDPIDGTRDYVRGNPLWANLIALEADGEVVLGVVNLPGLGKLYTGVRGQGAHCNGRPMHASGKSGVEDAVLCFNAYSKMEHVPFRDTFDDWASRFWAFRGLGGAADAMMVAAGEAEVFIEPSAAPWDFAPLQVIAEEAGAVFLNFDGGRSIHARSAVICAPGLAPEMRRVLGLR
jgi:histidinol-phosphatase